MCLVAGTFLWRHSHDCDTCDVNVSLEVGSQQAQREQECCQSNTIMVEVHSQSSMPEVRMCPVGMSASLQWLWMLPAYVGALHWLQNG